MCKIAFLSFTKGYDFKEKMFPQMCSNWVKSHVIRAIVTPYQTIDLLTRRLANYFWDSDLPGLLTLSHV